MKKCLKSSFLAVVLMTIPSLAQACPMCIGRDGGGYVQKIMVPVAVFLIAPFIVFGFIFLLVKKHSPKNTINDSKN